MAFSGPPLPITPINTFTTGEQTHSSIAGLAGGGYVVTWTSAAQDGSSGGIYAHSFDANGVAVGVELLINTTTALNQDFAEVAALTGGGYVIAWDSEGLDGSFTGVYLQQFDAAGVAVGGEVTVATMAVNHSPLLAHLTELASGRIGVTWSDMFGATLSDDPYFQLVRANGTLFGGPVQMNTTPGTLANQAQVVALPSGGFMAVWTESIGATVGVGDARMVGRIYDNAGVAATAEFTVSDDVTHLRYDPAVTLGGDGNVHVGWLEQTGNGEVYVMRAVDETGSLKGDQFFLSDLVPQSGINRFISLTTLANGDIIAL